MAEYIRDGFLYAQGLSIGPKATISVVVLLSVGLLLYFLWLPQLAATSRPAPTTEVPKTVIVWDDHLGHSYSGAGAALRTSAFQIGAVNNLGHELRLERAYAISSQGAGEKELQIAAGGEWHPVAGVRPIGNQQALMLRITFDEVLSKQVFANWMSFQITLVYNGGLVSRKDVTEQMVRTVYESFRPSPIGPQIYPK